MAKARSTQKYYADKKRRQVTYNEGDFVMLESKSINEFSRSSLPKKWRTKYLGPLRVKQVMGPVTSMIELPPSMKKAHNVFHVSKWKPYKRPCEDQGPISVVIGADGTVEQEVQSIIGKKRVNRRLHYLVLFEGDPESFRLPRSALSNCMHLIKKHEAMMRASSSKNDANVIQ